MNLVVLNISAKGKQGSGKSRAIKQVEEFLKSNGWKPFAGNEDHRTRWFKDSVDIVMVPR